MEKFTQTVHAVLNLSDIHKCPFMSIMKTDRRTVGDIGEDSICRYLLGNKYVILERNYLRKWGELDIVAENKGIIHFIEVKSISISPVSRETLEDISSSNTFNIFVSHETDDDFPYNPEENVHFWKKKRMSRAIRTFILEKKISDDKEFQVDVAVCILNFNKNEAKIRLIDNIVLE